MERISEFMDGEADESTVVRQANRLREDSPARRAWSEYHLIGDVLRGHSEVSEAFGAEVMRKLADEPTALVPGRMRMLRVLPRLALPVAASVAGLGLVAWISLFDNPFLSKAPERLALKENPAALAVNPPGAPASPDGEVNEYLLAHQQFSPSTSIQGVASYVRTVSSDGGDR